MAKEESSFLEYNSVQFIKVRNTKLALTYYGILFLILVYVVGYTVIYDKGYQSYDNAVASTMTKIKGSAGAEDANGNWEVFDEYDMCIPPFVPDGSFTGMGYILTPNQTKGICSGNDAGTELCDCADFNTVEECCQAGTYTENGMKTGVCNESTGFCELQAWCPLESTKTTWLSGVEDWTLFARVNVRFPKFDYSLSNTDNYNAISTPNGVNLFSLGGIVSESNTKWEDLQASKGGVFVGNFEYNCDLDSSDKCEPSIFFYRLDDPTNSLSTGFNFRYQVSSRDYTTGIVTRDLWKLTGIYVIFQVYGEAGQFDLATLGVTFGAGLSYLAIATVVCDIIMEYFLTDKEKYLARKFDLVDIEERERLKSGGVPGEMDSESSVI